MAVLDDFRVGIGVFEARDLNAIVREGRNRTDFAENWFLVVFRLSDFENSSEPHDSTERSAGNFGGSRTPLIAPKFFTDPYGADPFTK